MYAYNLSQNSIALQGCEHLEGSRGGIIIFEQLCLFVTVSNNMALLAACRWHFSQFHEILHLHFIDAITLMTEDFFTNVKCINQRKCELLCLRRRPYWLIFLLCFLIRSLVHY
jgi:hypothetical protein